MGQLWNRVKMTVSGTPGTGTITLGAATSGYQSFAAAGVATGALVSYVIEDGANWELGTGTYTASGTTLARSTILGSSNSGAAISATSAALVYLTALASDIPSTAAGFLNFFRNAHMDVAQRGTSGSVAAAAAAYTLDGWIISATGAAAAWSQQYQAGIAGNSLNIACATGLTGCTLLQRIESYIGANALTTSGAAQKLTVQFAISHQTGAAITPSLATGTASVQDNFGTVTADLASTSLQTIANGAVGVVSYTFTPSANISNGYQVQLLFGAALNAASGYVIVSLADIRVTPNAPLGLNSAPPIPETRAFAAELDECQRYAQLLRFGASFVFVDTYGFIAGQNLPFVVTLTTAMRSAPTVSLFAGSMSSSNVTGLSYNATARFFNIAATATSATTRTYYLSGGTGISFLLTAEL